MNAEVFFSYSHKDEDLRDQLAKHLSSLRRQGIISTWYDREIQAGAERTQEIQNRFNSAQIILLLVSADFLDSDYCYNVELKQAMKRHENGDVQVIPIIVRPVDWQNTPFSKLQTLPKDGKPITSWNNRDEAFLEVTQGIRHVSVPGSIQA